MTSIFVGCLWSDKPYSSKTLRTNVFVITEKILSTLFIRLGNLDSSTNPLLSFDHSPSVAAMSLARRSFICHREFPLVLLSFAVTIAKIQRCTILRQFYSIHLLIAFVVQQQMLCLYAIYKKWYQYIAEVYFDILQNYFRNCLRL